MSPGGTAAARKIDNGGSGAVGSSGVAEVSGDGQDSEAEALRAWARAQAESFPPWSEQQWKDINAVLGYKLRERE